MPILNDGVQEPSETFRLTLSDPSSGAALGAPRAAVVTIIDNDPGVQLEFSREWVRETDPFIEVTVLRGNDGELGPFTVDHTTINGTAQAGIQFVEVAGTLSFGAGETRRSFSVELLDDPTVFTQRRPDPVLCLPFRSRSSSIA